MADEDAAAVELTVELMALSKIGKTIDAAGFAYFKLDCTGRRVGSIKELEKYEHLRQIDLSKNLIKDIAPLNQIPHLLNLNLASNAIKSLKGLEEGSLAQLLHLDLSGNQLTKLEPLIMPALKFASFAKNEIASAEEFVGHDKLVELDLSENKLQALTGIANMPQLVQLNLSGNEIASFEGLAGLPELKELDLSKNSLEGLDAPWAETPVLKSLKVNDNQISDVKAFEKLRLLVKLRELWAGGVVSEAGEADRPELLICHWNLDAIDGQAVTEEERAACRQRVADRMEEERQRIEAEAAAAAEADA